MKLALLGYPIKHSLSPSLYREFLGDKLHGYELLEVKSTKLIPSLKELSIKYDGLNITSPYKKHFFSQVQIQSEIVKKLGAINTISFTANGVFGTNTDVDAVTSILADFSASYGEINIILLGSGVMADLTKMLAQQLSLPLVQYSRKNGDTLSDLDLTAQASAQTIIINACSRDFEFKGKLNPSHIFWDYNYQLIPHQNTLPSQVHKYIDGEEMLRRQAQAAVKFWAETSLKLKC